MNTTTMSTSGVAGRVGFAFAAVAAAAMVFVWSISTSGALDPPAWVRIGGSLLVPVGIAGAVGAGLLGLRGSGRRWAIAGLAVAAAAVVVFVVLVNLSY